MKLIDLTGETFGKWIVLCKDEKTCGKTRWICQCACGAEVSVLGDSLSSGKSKQCKKCRHIDKVKNLCGMQFGKWTVIKEADNGHWLCRCNCGTEKLVQKSSLFHGKGEGCKKCWKEKNKIVDLTGEKFGKWIVLQRDKDRSLVLDFWLCRCECGVEKSVYGSHLKLGKSISCRHCSNHKHKGKLNSVVWGRILYGAKVRKILVNLGEPIDAKKFLYDLLYEKQKCRCALSDMPIHIANTAYGANHGETTASLDRIDSSKGYTRDNVQWVHKCVNTMKWQFGQDQFIDFCEAIVKKNRSLVC